MQQTTVGEKMSYSGIGLHSGKPVNITLQPAPADSGIVFSRIDLPEAPRVRAAAQYVTNSMRATTLEDKNAKVFTVEHLLAAFHVMGIDNCLVEIDSVEPPVADGSALPFVELIEQAGISRQQDGRRVISIDRQLAVYDGNRFVMILPYDGFRITFTSVNPHPRIGTQFADYEITPEVFRKEIASARTIGFMHEVEALHAQGLALGGNMENAVIYDGGEVLTPLRFSDELVRHKVLDCIGDLFLAGPLRGHVVAVQSGHSLNTALAQKIVKEYNLIDGQ